MKQKTAKVSIQNAISFWIFIIKLEDTLQYKSFNIKVSIFLLSIFLPNRLHITNGTKLLLKNSEVDLSK